MNEGVDEAVHVGVAEGVHAGVHVCVDEKLDKHVGESVEEGVNACNYLNAWSVRVPGLHRLCPCLFFTMPIIATDCRLIVTSGTQAECPTCGWCGLSRKLGNILSVDSG